MPPKKKFSSQYEKNKAIMDEYKSVPLYREPSSSGSSINVSQDTTPKLRPIPRPKSLFPERDAERLRLEKQRFYKKKFEPLINQIADNAVERSIFNEQKGIKEMIDVAIGGMVDKAETQGKINVTAKYDYLKEQMNNLEKGFSFLGGNNTKQIKEYKSSIGTQFI